ncbi:uncharacterized protein LOC144124112 [Amblyomma americanum]
MEGCSRARIRPVRREDIPGLLHMKRSLRQLCGEASPQMLQSLDPDGFLAAVSDGGQLCGGCSIAILSDSVATVGFWCVLPELLDSPLAEQLLRAGLRRAGNRNVVLRSDGATVRELQRTELFPRVGRWLFHKVGPAQPCLDALPEKVEGVRVRDYNIHAHADRVGSYATEILKMPMREYLRAMSKQPGVGFKVAFEGNALCGLGTIERDVGGCALVRHLLANDLPRALVVLRSLIDDFPLASSAGICMAATGKRFPATSPGAEKEEHPAFFYEPLGLRYVSTMLMSFTLREPAIDYNRVFALYTACLFAAIVPMFLCEWVPACACVCVSERRVEVCVCVYNF